MVKTNKMRPIHPGEILRDELEELKMSANELARALKVPTNRICDVLRGKRSVTADTALRLGIFFGPRGAGVEGARFWMNLQVAHDLRVAEIAAAKSKSLKNVGRLHPVDRQRLRLPPR